MASPEFLSLLDSTRSGDQLPFVNISWPTDGSGKIGVLKPSHQKVATRDGLSPHQPYAIYQQFIKYGASSNGALTGTMLAAAESGFCSNISTSGDAPALGLFQGIHKHGWTAAVAGYTLESQVPMIKILIDKYDLRSDSPKTLLNAYAAHFVPGIVGKVLPNAEGFAVLGKRTFHDQYVVKLNDERRYTSFAAAAVWQIAAIARYLSDFKLEVEIRLPSKPKVALLNMVNKGYTFLKTVSVDSSDHSEVLQADFAIPGSSYGPWADIPVIRVTPQDVSDARKRVGTSTEPIKASTKTATVKQNTPQTTSQPARTTKVRSGLTITQ